MARRSTDPTIDLNRILADRRKQPPKARWRVMVASDPSRPVRTFTLPRLLPALASLFAILLVVATVLLAFGSWKLSGSLGALERPRARDGAGRGQRRAGRRTTAAPSGDRRGAGVGAHRQGRRAAASASSPSNPRTTARRSRSRINLATGEVEPAGYVRLRHLMRCLRTGAETPIDPRLIDLLYRIALRTKQKIVLVSGFRAPMFSLATLSYHTRGMAADIRIPGMTPLMARDLAESMGVHGLGYYPVSGFIHVDVRDDKSRWTDYRPRDRSDGEGQANTAPSRGEDVNGG